MSAYVSLPEVSVTVALLTVVSTGVSLTPSKVMVIVWVALAAVPSVALTTKAAVAAAVVLSASTTLSLATNLYAPLVVFR